MKTATLQNLGIKFIGLYCAASGLSEWFDSLAIVLDYSDSEVAWESILRLGRWFSLFSPIVLILFGLYLRKDGVLSILITSLEKIRRVVGSRELLLFGGAR
jgi:hypothetical protein